MSREIKFRAWCPHEKRFHVFDFADNHYILYGGAGSAIGLNINLPWQYKNNRVLAGEPDWRIEDLVFQQYTGLKDKNGKEIYEGDILKYSNTYFESQGGQLANPIFQAEWVGAGFVFLGEPALQEDANYYEIFGNIFENPELLWK